MSDNVDASATRRKSKSARKPINKLDIYDLLRFLLVLVLFDLLISIFYSLQTSTFADGAMIASVAMGISVASILGGAFVGFIFGIPKTIQQGSKPQPSAAPTTGQIETTTKDGESGETSEGYLSNTNLEEISDWLTKILVGVGLTQLTTLPQGLNKVATHLAPGLGNFGSSTVFAICLMILNVVGGFLLSYLCTRIFLKGALLQIDKSEVKNIALEAVNKQQIQQVEENKKIEGLRTALENLEKSVSNLSKDSAGNLTPTETIVPNLAEYMENFKNASILTKDKAFRITEDAINRITNKAGEKEILISAQPFLEKLADEAPGELAKQYRSKLDSLNSRLNTLR